MTKQEILDTFKDIDFVYNNSSKHETLSQMLDDLLKEQKTGHWVRLENCANEGVYCSECHTKIFELHQMKKKSAQYCGHCGAKMEKEIVRR